MLLQPEPAGNNWVHLCVHHTCRRTSVNSNSMAGTWRHLKALQDVLGRATTGHEVIRGRRGERVGHWEIQVTLSSTLKRRVGRLNDPPPWSLRDPCLDQD
jgi:hypothetical protein